MDNSQVNNAKKQTGNKRLANFSKIFHKALKSKSEWTDKVLLLLNN